MLALPKIPQRNNGLSIGLVLNQAALGRESKPRRLPMEKLSTFIHVNNGLEGTALGRINAMLANIECQLAFTPSARHYPIDVPATPQEFPFQPRDQQPRVSEQQTRLRHRRDSRSAVGDQAPSCLVRAWAKGLGNNLR
jgi:hypothetical protein